jgi:hypothetical protein
MSAATSARSGMTMYSAVPLRRSRNAARSNSPLPATAAPAGEVTSVVLRIPVCSPPPCGEGLGVGVRVVQTG